jgi:hypothetical protein
MSRRDSGHDISLEELVKRRRLAPAESDVVDTREVRKDKETR